MSQYLQTAYLESLSQTSKCSQIADLFALGLDDDACSAAPGPESSPALGDEFGDTVITSGSSSDIVEAGNILNHVLLYHFEALFILRYNNKLCLHQPDGLSQLSGTHRRRCELEHQQALLA